ncbi:MAG: glycine zipper 2TM domain-containing protein [Alcanivorax sp.]|nr:glycine zipper 2TM domain-containing protein [Alcanivorax sp.]
MKSAAIVALSVVGTAAIAGIGYGTYQAVTPPKSGYAEVIKVDPIVKTWQEPHQVCQQVTVQHQKPTKDKHQLAGSVIGAVVGGVIGHQFGGGSGKDAATAGGAIAGGIAGNRIQKNMQDKNTYTTTEQQCHTEMQKKSRTEAYNVTYRFADKESTIRMEKKPNERLRIEDGEVVLN